MNKERLISLALMSIQHEIASSLEVEEDSLMQTMSMQFPHVETLLKLDDRDCLQFPLLCGLNLFNRFKTMSTQRFFEFRE